MTEQEITQHKEAIDKMSQLELARLWRFAPSGHIYFDSSLPLAEYFREKFKEKGGFTPSISKRIGWDN